MAQFTKYTGTMTGQAGSLCTAMDTVASGAGWTTTFTAANKRIYRMGGGNQYYLRVLDDATTPTGLGREATVRACTGTPSDIDTLTGSIYPTVAQLGNAASIFRKSNTADGTARNWICYADSKTMLWLVQTGDSGSTYVPFYFGDTVALYAGDVNNNMIVTSGPATNGSMLSSYFRITSTNTLAAATGHYHPNPISGTGGSNATAVAIPFSMATQGFTGGSVAYKNQGDGNILIDPVFLFDTGTIAPHDSIRGVYATLHAATNFADQDTFSGTGAFAGKTFIVFKGSIDSGNDMFIIETSNTLS